MTRFNWQLATVEELAQHISTCKEETLRQQVNYYKFLNNNTVLERISKAKKYVTLWKLQEQLLLIKRELGIYDV